MEKFKEISGKFLFECITFIIALMILITFNNLWVWIVGIIYFYNLGRYNDQILEFYLKLLNITPRTTMDKIKEAITQYPQTIINSEITAEINDTLQEIQNRIHKTELKKIKLLSDFLLEIGQKEIANDVLKKGFPEHIFLGESMYKGWKWFFEQFSKVSKGSFLEDNRVVFSWLREPKIELIQSPINDLSTRTAARILKS